MVVEIVVAAKVNRRARQRMVIFRRCGTQNSVPWTLSLKWVLLTDPQSLFYMYFGELKGKVPLPHQNFLQVLHIAESPIQLRHPR
jgi:hypothetical protein